MSMAARAVIYARCSTEEECQKDALVKQAEEAKECVRQKEWILVDSYVESRSGTSTKGRSEYSRLFEDLNKDKFEIIVIKSQDRLMRNTKDWYLFVDRLTTAGKKLYMYIEQKFYTADDALITGIKAILAEEYSRELSKKINNAHQNRQKKGTSIILTQNTYGLCRLPDRSIALIEPEAEIKKRMYQLCAAGYGCRTIAAILRKDGVRNRRGNPFSDADILRMIRNPINKGTVVMNRVHYDFDTKKRVRMPKEQQYVYEHKVPAIVSDALWEAANRAIDERAGAGRRGKTDPKAVDAENPYSEDPCAENPCTEAPGRTGYPLGGKIICGICGQPYYRTVRRRYRNREKIYEWKCSRYLQEGRGDPSDAAGTPREEKARPAGCRNVHLKEETLFELLEEGFREQDGPDMKYIAEKVKGLLYSVLGEEGWKRELEKERQACSRIEAQMKLLAQKLLEGVLTDQIYRMKQAELEEKLEQARSKEKELEQPGSEYSERRRRMAEIEEALREGSFIQRALTAERTERADRILVFPGYLELVFPVGQELAFPAGQELVFPAGQELMLPAGHVRIEAGNRFRYFRQKQEERERLVDLIKENPGITAAEMAERLGISLSGVHYRLGVLKKEGRIQFCRRTGNGQWNVL